jgi:two-component system sensor histidine kinase KdpD
MLNLAMGALRRCAPRARVAVDILATDTGMRFRVSAPGAALQPGERLTVFEPYGHHAAGAAGYGLGLALARAVVELHEGKIWVEDLGGNGFAFVFELGWKQAGTRPRRAPRRQDQQDQSDNRGERDKSGGRTVET